MSKEDLRKLSVAQLKDLVRKHNIKGFSTMRKEELVSAIHKHQRKSKSAAPKPPGAPRRPPAKSRTAPKPTPQPVAMPRRSGRASRGVNRLITTY